MSRHPNINVLTPDRLADLQAYARGEQPELQPLRRRWLVNHGYLELVDPPRPPREALGRQRIMVRRHELTDKGGAAVAAAGEAEVVARPPQPRTGYLSDAVIRSVRR